MERKIVVCMTNLTESQKNIIKATAGELGFNVEFYASQADALPYVETAEIIFGNTPMLCGHAPNLKWMCSSFAGVEPYLVKGAFASEAAVLTNSSGAYGVTIAEHIIMVTLEMMRREAEYRAIVNAHSFKRDLRIRSIYGSRITLLGTGDIGKKTAERLRAFKPATIVGVSRSGRHVDGMDRNVTVSELDGILPETDLLILSLPGTPETAHIMNEARLQLLPETAYLVNVGRGSTLDQRALEKRLRNGQLAGAALDVFEKEPLPPEDSLWSCPGLHITTHTAGNTTLSHTVQFIVDMFLEDLHNYAAGRPLKGLVDRQRGY